MLALTTRQGGSILPRRTSSRCTQPWPAAMLCAADSESPSTSTVFGAAASAAPLHPIHSTASHPRSRRMSEPFQPLLEARDVSKTVRGPEGRLDILAGVSLAVHAGESFAIVGASGSGKTTLLGLLAGLDVPSAGAIHLQGHALQAMDEEARADLRRRLVGFVFQSFHLLPALTAEENVMLPLELEGRDDARVRANEALDAFGLHARMRHSPAQLAARCSRGVELIEGRVAAPAAKGTEA